MSPEKGVGPHVGIDASNIQGGGGFSHLRNFLAAAEPEAHGIGRCTVWSNSSVIGRLPEKPWLEKVAVPALDGHLVKRLMWQRFSLPRVARGCDLLFAPGGNVPAGIRPVLTMSRNMLPFEVRERDAYGHSLMGYRLRLLRVGQARTLSRADGVIFLTGYAHDAIRGEVEVRGAVRIIPHGVEERFRMAPRPQRALSECSEEKPLRAVYVSAVDLYKHQWKVAEAAAKLRAEGIPIDVTFVGKSYPAALTRLQETLRRLDPEGHFLHYPGPVPFEEIHALNRDADLCIYASSCENMPNILLESMAAGLPIACSKLGPMPSMLGDSGVYFDPYDADDIARAVAELARDRSARERFAREAYERSAQYSWQRCADETLDFLKTVIRAHAEGRSPAGRKAALEERSCGS